LGPFRRKQVEAIPKKEEALRVLAQAGSRRYGHHLPLATDTVKDWLGRR
jgi:hypothetical protein